MTIGLMHTASMCVLDVLEEREISPSADLAPVCIGRFCCIVTVALDEYHIVDQKTLGVAALILTGLVAREKGWASFRWIPEFILPFALPKVSGFLEDYFKEQEKWKSCLVVVMVDSVHLSLRLYLKSSRNPQISLRLHIPLNVSFVAFSYFLSFHFDSIRRSIEPYSKKYAFDIATVSRCGLIWLLIFLFVPLIERSVGAPVLKSDKFILIQCAASLLFTLLEHSPNSPLKLRS